MSKAADVREPPSPQPVLRGAVVEDAARVVGRRQAPVVSTSVASALSRLTGQSAAAPVPAPVVDEAALRRARDEGWQAGRGEGRAEVLREGTHSGFEEGLRQGLIEGRSAGEAEVHCRLAQAQEHAAERLQRLDALHSAWATQLASQLAQRLAAAEDDMVALCYGVICRILGDSLVTRTGTAQAMRAAIEEWIRMSEQQARGDAVVVHVHPADFDAMKSDDMLARWLVQQGLKGVRWQAREDVRLGGCIVQSGEGDLDARLETQLEILRDQLQRGRAASTGA
jgi:flagellar assembly protein FliH